LTDRLKVSREKLAYIVDSTSAPVCSLSVVSTWIAYQVGLINTQIQGTVVTDSAYSIFVKSIPYSFYSIFAIFLVCSIALSGRDYGPMLKAEHRARTTGDVIGIKAGEMSGDFKQLEGITPKAINMIVPILALVGTALIGMWWTGGGADGMPLAEAINASDSMTALLWGGIAGIITCMVMYSVQKIGTLEQLINACVEGMHVMVFANLILIFAWALGSVSDDLGTANFIISNVENIISPSILPLIIFITSGVISFMIGTSWGTMAIVTPIAIPLSIALNVPVHITISGIISGSVMGDHCSPISDTTVLSSMFSGCNHIEHVRTQIPYALTSSGIAILSYILLSFGLPIFIVLPIGLILVFTCIIIFSKASSRKYGIQVPITKYYTDDQTSLENS